MTEVCTACHRTAIAVESSLAAVRAKLDDYVDAPREQLLRTEASLHNRMRELKVAVRARHRHLGEHVTAAHRAAR